MTQILTSSKYTERNHLKECNDDRCRLNQVFIIRIWLDFYEDDMSPWVLSSIHIQRVKLYSSLLLYPELDWRNFSPSP
jgi:hypothetical protein